MWRLGRAACWAPRGVALATVGGMTLCWDENWDKRAAQPKNTDAAAGGATKAARTLWLIRHGQYVIEKGRPDTGTLTELGRQQAQKIGERLKATGVPFKVIHHSPMPRAKETAEIISAALPELELRENGIIREGAPIEPVPPSATWKPPAENFWRDSVRIEASFREFVHRPDPSAEGHTHEVVVAHGNVFRYWTLRALQLPPEAWLRFGIVNCSLTKITIYQDGRVSVSAVGDAGHLPYAEQTFN